MPCTAYNKGKLQKPAIKSSNTTASLWHHKYLLSYFSPAWKVKTRHSFWLVKPIIQLSSCITTGYSQGRILSKLPWKYLLQPIKSVQNFLLYNCTLIFKSQIHLHRVLGSKKDFQKTDGRKGLCRSDAFPLVLKIRSQTQLRIKGFLTQYFILMVHHFAKMECAKTYNKLHVQFYRPYKLAHLIQMPNERLEWTAWYPPPQGTFPWMDSREDLGVSR